MQCDPPNKDLERLNGTLDFKDPLHGRKPLTRSNFLLRGVVVRYLTLTLTLIYLEAPLCNPNPNTNPMNSDYRQTIEVYGIITHTGAQTKIVQNNEGEPPKKRLGFPNPNPNLNSNLNPNYRTHMDVLLNRCVSFCFLLTFVICIALSVIFGEWTAEHGASKW